MDRNTMRNLYKHRNDPVRNIERKRNDNTQKMKIQRQDRRTRMFNERRSMSGQDDIENESGNTLTIESTSPKSNKVLERKLALQKYKLEKEAIKKALNIKKKPPFIVGIPHHGNSPILKTITAKRNQNQVRPLQDIKNKRVTRANAKYVQGNVIKEENNVVFKSPIRFFPFNERKSVFVFQHNKVGAIKKLTSPHTPTVLKRSAQKIEHPKGRDVNNGIKKEMKNPRVLGKVLKKVLEPKKRSSTSSTDSSKSLAAPLSDTEALSQQSESDVPNCDILSEPEAEVAVKLELVEKSEELNPETALQRELVDKESDRLLSLAEEWESIALTSKIPQDTVDEIDSVVGQTRLLTRDKFNQFRRLIDQFESQQGSHKITVEDLNGFWDMVYLQVEPLVKRYDKLVILKSNNWEEPKPATPAKKKRRGPPKRKVTKGETSAPNQPSPHSTVKDEEVLTMKTPTIEEKKSFNVLNLSRTPRRYSSSPYIAMRLSGVGRTSKIPSPSEVVPANYTLTPKSVLKTELNSGSTAKKKVVFNASPLETGETVECTPRRSIRLKCRTPGSQIKLCSSCQSPDCTTLICSGKSKRSAKRRSRRSQKIVSMPAEQEVENMPTESSNTSCVKENAENKKSRKSRQSQKILPLSPNQELAITSLKPLNSENIQPERVEGVSGKRFVLRPSKLVLNDSTNNHPVPEKTRRSTLHGSKENSSPKAEDLESSGVVRRSTRITSAKRVTFNSSATEKHNFKLPATPYGKKGCNQDSLSD